MALDRGFVTLVTGLPRCGTSMMMRMLEAGGLPVMIDEIRAADEDNPRGYYEFEPVKKTKEDPTWVASALGKAVKLVYRLLQDLPADQTYRALFMRRKLSEVYASQEEMLRRKGKPQAGVDLSTFEKMFEGEIARTLRWLRAQPNFSFIEVDYNNLLANPEAQVSEIDAFLAGGLDTGAMLAVVEPGLYRRRS
jgi:hypothetical protein